LDVDVYDESGGLSAEKVSLIYERARHWPPEQKLATLNWLKAATTRDRIRKKYRNVAEMAKSVDPDYNITPALALIADAIEQVITKPRHNLLVTMPPQEGKSSLVSVWTPIRALQLNPNKRIILAAYGDALAEEHSGTCRSIIEQHGTDVVDPMTGAEVEDKIGLKLSPRSKRVSAWKIDGHRGGMVAVGLGSAITGRAADLFIIDDPYKNMMEADSASHRAKVDEWLASVAMTRLSPEASMILIQTRWHPEDLAGKVLAAEAELPRELRTWRHLNIPAISEEGIKDALGRPPGVSMVSARGRTKTEFEATRRAVGERVWYAMYQGVPVNPAGGLFERSWFEPRAELPRDPVAAVVGVDPADSGEGDETGILGAVLTGTGDVVFTEDRSGHHTSDVWGRKAVQLALEIGAREIVIEGFSTFNTYANVVKSAYREMHRETREKLARGERLEHWENRALAVTAPFLVTRYHEGGDAVARASLLRQQFELRRAKVVDYKLNVFIDQAADWQSGQHCPDRVSAAVVAHHQLYKLGQGRAQLASPLDRGHAAAPAWLSRRLGDGSTAALPFSRR